jgi:uncharacterized protein (DUF58 family)
MGLVLLSLVALGLRVQNNMLLAVVALLAVLIFLSVVWGAFNMHGLSVRVQPIGFPMAGHITTLELHLVGPGNRYGVSIRSVGKQACPNGSYRWTPAARGLAPLTGIRVESRFPLHLVRIWTTLVSPPIAVAPSPVAAHHRRLGSGTQGQDLASGEHEAADSPTELRAYEPGDSMARVHWRRFAQRGQLLVRAADTRAASEQLSRNIDYAQYEHLGHERALSALCFDLIEAEQRGMRWSLTLPSGNIYSSQPLAKTHALHALATA